MAMEIPGLKFSENEGRLLASIEPASAPPLLDVDMLRSVLGQAGYQGWFLLDEALATLVECYNASAETSELAVAERRDASFSVEISADSMSAWVNFVPAFGGKEVIPDDVFAALGEAAITYGIDPASVSALCAKGVPERVLAATGVAAENGRDTRFELLAADTRDRVPQVDAHGLIDFRDLGAIPLVVAEQPLMRRIPPTDGVAGRNVLGELLEPVPGRNEGFSESLIGAYVSRDDANLLLAVFNGQPVRSGNGVMVEQVMHVRNVNLASGNITFDGTVHVDGEVLPGMKVHATGDIIVTGVVDGGELDAGGDVRIAGGIIAQARVRAAGSVAARFVESAHVYAGTAIIIDDTALQSDLQAMNQIIIGVKSAERGRLAGGSARAMLLIRAPVLGGASGGVTAIQLGVNPVLEAKYKDLLERVEKQRADEANLEKLIKHLSSAQGDKGGMLERVKASWQQAVQAWAKLLPEKESLEDQLALIEGARLEVGVSVSGAVDMCFGKKSLRVRRNFDAGAFSLAGEKIVFTDPEGKETTAG
jgi:uncharacterized protein (DUF342 family)